MKPSGLRIIGGRLRGRRIKSIPGRAIRPTANRIRESIFNIIADQTAGQNVADLFAGTGALGLEALSRGAAGAVFVDHDPAAVAAIQHNVALLGVATQAHIRKWDVLINLKCLNAFPQALSLIFIDPPYRQNMVQPALTQLHHSQRVQAGAMIVVEHSPHEIISLSATPFALDDQRRYGKTLVSFLKYMV